MTQALPQKRRLGRGLAALIGDDASEESVLQDARSLRHMPIELLHASPNNPRKAFKDEELEDLARSIKTKGLLQPLVVRQRKGGGYEIVAGERRWRAAQRAGVHDVPVLIRELTDGEALEIALIENIQRSDLNALEEARAYTQLLGQFAYTQQQLAESVGKSRSHVANTLRLLTLPPDVMALIESGGLTAGHARTLVASDSPSDLAARIVRLGLSVREAEQLARGGGKPRGKAEKTPPEKSPDIKALEERIMDTLGVRTEIVETGKEGGTVTIRYHTLEQLDHIVRRLESTM
jgi:ParB family transcriptional regulator, chromosome partitioning protein